MKGLIEILDGNLKKKKECLSGNVRVEVLQVSEKVAVLASLQRTVPCFEFLDKHSESWQREISSF